MVAAITGRSTDISKVCTARTPWQESPLGVNVKGFPGGMMILQGVHRRMPHHGVMPCAYPHKPGLHGLRGCARSNDRSSK